MVSNWAVFSCSSCSRPSPRYEDDVLGSPNGVSNCGGGSGGCMYWCSRRGILCGGGYLVLDGMVLEGQCPDVEVQHLRKLGSLMRRSKGPCSGVDVPT